MAIPFRFRIAVVVLLLVLCASPSLSRAEEFQIDSFSLGADLTLQLENMQSGSGTIDVRFSPYQHPDDDSHLYWLLEGVFDRPGTLETAFATYPVGSIDIETDLSFELKEMNVGGILYNVNFLRCLNVYDADNSFWMLGGMTANENLPTVRSVASPLALNGIKVNAAVAGSTVTLTGAAGAFVDVTSKIAGDCSGMQLRVQTMTGSQNLALQPDGSFQGTVAGNPGLTMQLVLVHRAGESLLGRLPIPADGSTATVASLYPERYAFQGITGLTPEHEYYLCEVEKNQSDPVTDFSGPNCSTVNSDGNGDLRLLLEKGRQYQLITDPNSPVQFRLLATTAEAEAFVSDQKISSCEKTIQDLVGDQLRGGSSPAVTAPASRTVGPETGDGVTLAINRLHFFSYTANTLSQYQACWWDWPFSVYSWHGLKSRAVADIPMPGRQWVDVTASVSPWIDAEADAIVALVCDGNATNCYAATQRACSCQIDQSTVRFSPAEALDAYSFFLKKGDAVAFLPEGGALFYEVYDLKYRLDEALATIHIYGDMDCNNYADYGDDGPEGFEQERAFAAFNQSAAEVAYFFQFPLLDYISKISISGGQDLPGQYVGGATGPFDYYFRYDMTLYVPVAGE
ncbi:MAG: hypothetical protein JXR89_05945 [Deltaproteobacteria bacterium]|nr:hypothetical protein [Deltaproteobacteria bacterium]